VTFITTTAAATAKATTIIIITIKTLPEPSTLSSSIPAHNNHATVFLAVFPLGLQCVKKWQ
jgi:hypothetical protein